MNENSEKKLGWSISLIGSSSVFPVPPAWKLSFYAVLYGVFLHCFMEWLFFLSKPSSFSVLTWLEKWENLFLPPLFLSILFLFFLFVFYLVNFLTAPFLRSDVRLFLSRLGPVFILAVIVFVLLDNFTYVLFGFGIVSLKGWARLCYGGLFLALSWGLYKGIPFSSLSIQFENKRPLFQKLFWGLLGASSFVFVLTALLNSGAGLVFDMDSKEIKSRPHILLVSVDGVEAKDMSVYAEGAVPTPFIEALSKESLLFENHFTNANKTSGSLPSVLTGKHPLTSHHLHAHTLLKGRHAYEHVPGILKRRGYATIQMGWKGHVDAGRWNMKGAFDVVNNKDFRRTAGFENLSSLFQGRFDLPLKFTGDIWNRAASRLTHSFGGARIGETHLADRKSGYVSDNEKTQNLFNFLIESDAPVFAQLHYDAVKFMGYKNEISNFDQTVEKIVGTLKEQGIWENTVLILYSDHGRHYRVETRLPFLIRFPEKVAIQTKANTQNIDIAPTILDYMKLEIPEWMDGRSLLKPRKRLEPIYAVYAREVDRGIPQKNIRGSEIGGPLSLAMIRCDEVYRVEAKDAKKLRRSKMKQHTDPCAPREVLSDKEAAQMIVKFMDERGYDVSRYRF